MWTDTRGRPLERPWCCPEPRCTPLFQAFDSSAKPLGTPQPGQSFSCFGRLTEPVTFVYDGVEHSNDLKSCWQSALKGVISWQENRDDWVWNEYGYREALARLDAETEAHSTCKACLVGDANGEHDGPCERPEIEGERRG